MFSLLLVEDPARAPELVSEVPAGRVLGLAEPSVTSATGPLHETTPTRSQRTSLGLAPVDWRGEGRILHVEDEPLVQEPTRLLLELLGFEVTTVGTGAEALQVFKDHPRGHFAIALLDLTLPGISGQRLVEAIEELDHGSRLVLTSGRRVSTEDEPELGRYPFLPKPYMIKDLRGLLWQALA